MRCPQSSQAKEDSPSTNYVDLGGGAQTATASWVYHSAVFIGTATSPEIQFKAWTTSGTENILFDSISCVEINAISFDSDYRQLGIKI